MICIAKAIRDVNNFSRVSNLLKLSWCRARSRNHFLSAKAAAICAMGKSHTPSALRLAATSSSSERAPLLCNSTSFATSSAVESIVPA